MFSLLVSPGCHEEDAVSDPSSRLVLPAAPIDSNARSSARDQGIVAYIGHGSFFGQHGETIQPTVGVIERTHVYYIQKFASHEKASSIGAAFLRQSIPDRTIADSVYVERLIEAVDPPANAGLNQAIRALRSWYLMHVISDPAQRALLTNAEGPSELRTTSAALSTEASGRDYIDDCRREGVPVPEFVLETEEWTNWGEIGTYVVPEGPAELWSYESLDPAGVCVALPRWDQEGETAAHLLGVICFGTYSGKVCYWDGPNPRERFFKDFLPRGEAISIDEFVGGYDLQENAQRECSDCHAGENPFIIHPYDNAAFTAFINSQVRRNPAVWPDHIVHPDWVNNPGPLPSLGPTSDPTQRCDSCHHQNGEAGRFPLVSADKLRGYCGRVLELGAYRQTNPTMPFPYQEHIDWLRRACDNPSQPGQIVTKLPANDPDVVSAPFIVEPLYACTEAVGVRGAAMGAQLEFYVRGSLYATRIVEDEYGEEEFIISPPLDIDDEVYAVQTVAGMPSADSKKAYAYSHFDDFPEGLPAPKVAPEIVHECATRIGAAHKNGVKLDVEDGSVIVSDQQGRSHGWTPVSVSDPLIVDEQVRVRQRLCDDTSDWSQPEFARAAPLSLPRVGVKDTFGDSTILVEPVVEGASVTIAEPVQPQPFVSIESWPATSFRRNIKYELGRAVIAGEPFRFQQNLCGVASPPVNLVPRKDCSQLPAPAIAPPLPGDVFVIVVSAAPTATIRVWSGTDKLGEGSGSVVLLSRPLVDGETIVVAQQVGECIGTSGQQLTVQGEAN